MPSADQVPVNCTHSTMRWPEWVVLIAGSTGSALRAVRPFQLSHHAGCPTRSLSRRECDGFLVALAPGHHCPSHSGHLVGKRDGSNLGGPPRQQRCKPRPVLGTVELRMADHGERTGCGAAQSHLLSCRRNATDFAGGLDRPLPTLRLHPIKAMAPSPVWWGHFHFRVVRDDSAIRVR
jgi:hypothetical protein